MKKRLLFLLSILPFIVSAQNPGGVAGVNLWLKADAGTSQTSGDLTGWLDQVGTNTFIVTGTPSYFADTINFNPTIGFANSDLPSSLPSNRLDGDVSISVVEAYAVFRDGANNAHGSIMSSTSAGTTYPLGFFLGSNNQFVSVADGDEQNTYPYVLGGQYHIANIDVSTSISPFSSARINSSSTAFTVGTGDFSSVLITPLIGGVQNAAGSFYEHFNGQLAELIFYPSSLSATERQKIESYLGIKYGIVLDAGIGNYISSVDSVIWDASDATYHNDVIGIARDDNSGLLQRQSTTNDDSTQIYLSTLAADNATNGGSFSGDNQFVVIGHNNEALQSLGSLEYPAGQGIFKRLEREWKIVNTEFDGTFSMDIQLSANDTNFATDLVLLVDADGDFSDATVATNPTFAIADGNVSITGITTTEIPTDSTRYITIASVNRNSALPVNLVRFDVNNMHNEEVAINWTTASEKSNKLFSVERSNNGLNWEVIKVVEGKGNSEISNSYSYMDTNPYQGMNYYRLRQEDYNGDFNYSQVRAVSILKSEPLSINPNPSNSVIEIRGDLENGTLSIYNMIGLDVSNNIKILSKNESTILLDITALKKGVYILSIGMTKASFIKE